MTRKNRVLCPISAVCFGLLALGACVIDPDSSDVDQTSVAIESPDIEDVPGCPGGWHYVWSYDGFAGHYTRWTPAPDGELATLSIKSVVEQEGTIFVNGTYTRTVRDGFWFTTEAGRYSAVPANLLIGSFIGFLDPTEETLIDLYAVIGERRNPFTGAIQSMCIAKVDDDADDPIPPIPFVISRIGL